MDQLPLWDDRAHSRRGDPRTSKLAAKYMAESGAAETMLGIAYRTLLKNPGRTAKELDGIAGYTDGAIRKRLDDLKKRGLAYIGPERRCTITDMTAQTWYPVEPN